MPLFRVILKQHSELIDAPSLPVASNRFMRSVQQKQDQLLEATEITQEEILAKFSVDSVSPALEEKE